MSCTFDIPPKRQQEGLDIVRGDTGATVEVGEFLIALQENPLPAARQRLSPKDATSFWCRLNCGVYISWRIVASPEDMLNLSFGHVSPAVLVEVLGFGRSEAPSK